MKRTKYLWYADDPSHVGLTAVITGENDVVDISDPDTNGFITIYKDKSTEMVKAPYMKLKTVVSLSDSEVK